MEMGDTLFRVLLRVQRRLQTRVWWDSLLLVSLFLLTYFSLSQNEIVVAASNQQSTWYIEEAGSNGQDELYVVRVLYLLTQQFLIHLFQIKVPNQDFLWTKTPRTDLDNGVSSKA